MTLSYNVYGNRRLSLPIRRHRPDLTYEHDVLQTFYGIWASRRHGIPLVPDVNAPLSSANG